MKSKLLGNTVIGFVEKNSQTVGDFISSYLNESVIPPKAVGWHNKNFTFKAVGLFVALSLLNLPSDYKNSFIAYQLSN